MTATVLSLYARKGGVGRTMLTQNLAGACAERDVPVLVVDTDPQASVSKNFLGAAAVERLRPHESIAALFDARREPEADSLIHPTGIDNIRLLPASDYLEAYDQPRPQKLGDIAFALRDFLDEVLESFVMILIDTPPAVSNLPAWSSLLAADYVVTPVTPEKNSSESVLDVKARIAAALEHGNPDLVDLGFLVNNMDRRRATHRAVEIKLRQLYGSQVFEAVLPSRVAYVEAPYQLMPITHLAPKSEEADLIRSVLDELIRRINAADALLGHQLAEAG